MILQWDLFTGKCDFTNCFHEEVSCYKNFCNICGFSSLSLQVYN